jgi:N-acetylneuraminic acid mutarotase
MIKNILKVNIYLATILCWLNSTAQVFQTTSTFTSARYAHCTEQSLNNKVLIMGGAISSGASINSVYEYEPTSNTWLAKASIPNATGLSKSTSVKLNNGNLLLFGGSQNSSTAQSNNVFQYNINLIL